MLDTARASSGTSSGRCGGSCGDVPGEAQALVQLNRAVAKRGLGTHDGESLEGMLGPCELHWKSSYTIDPDGLVYKCPALAGRPEMAVASVSGGAAEKVAPLVGTHSSGNSSFTARPAGPDQA